MAEFHKRMTETQEPSWVMSTAMAIGRHLGAGLIVGDALARLVEESDGIIAGTKADRRKLISAWVEATQKQIAVSIKATRQGIPDMDEALADMNQIFGLAYFGTKTVDLLEGIPDVTLMQPDGTFYCFVDFSAFDSDSTRLSNRFLEKIRVVTVPGIEFGMEGYLRVSFCGAMEDVVEGVRRIRWLLNENGSPELAAGDCVFTR